MEVSYISFDSKLHVGQIAIAQTLMPEVEAFFARAIELSFPIAKVVPAAEYGWDDERLMAENVSSGFNYRLIAGLNNPSAHAKGLAFDINPMQNPYIRYLGDQTLIKPQGAVYDSLEQGTLTANHPLVKLMQGFGWEWGGEWPQSSGRVDYQHFQKQIP